MQKQKRNNDQIEWPTDSFWPKYDKIGRHCEAENQIWKAQHFY